MEQRRTGGLHIARMRVQFHVRWLCAWLSLSPLSFSLSPRVWWIRRVSVREEAPLLQQHPYPEEGDSSVSLSFTVDPSVVVDFGGAPKKPRRTRAHTSTRTR